MQKKYLVLQITNKKKESKERNKVKESRDRLELSVYKKNTNAISFYKKNGFEIINENIDNNTKEIEYTMIWNKNIM